MWPFIFVWQHHQNKKSIIAHLDNNTSRFYLKMARLAQLPKNQYISLLPTKIKTQRAIQWLINNPKETPVAAARLYFIEKENSFFATWRRAKKKLARGQDPFKNLSYKGQNRILSDKDNAAVIKYATDKATNREKSTTLQMLYNAIVFLCVGYQKPSPS